MTLLAFVAGAGWLQAGDITVPNRSFESPFAPYVNINIDAWQKAPKPAWYDESGGFLWDQLIGGFANPAANDPDYLDNCDGRQAIWLFAVPEVGLFQDYDSLDWSHTNATHAFNILFEPGKSYTLTVGVNGGGGNMRVGVPLELSLYYRDAASNFVTVAATLVTNSLAAFPTHTHFWDYSVKVPAVKIDDPWAGKNIGIRFLSLVDSGSQGGYWDLDNVRLASALQPTLQGLNWTNNQFKATVQSEPGMSVQVLASTNMSVPLSNWTSATVMTNTTGTLPFVDAVPSLTRRFYRVREYP